MSTFAKLQKTCNYGMFEPHPCNHDLREKPTLLESMRRFGFMPSGAIHCVHNGGDKLKVIRGHHRLMYAKRLNLPVWYIIDDTCNNIFFLEAIEKQQWGIDSFAQAYAKAGHRDYVTLEEFRRKHGLNMRNAASLVGGESASSNNKTRDVKEGSFVMGNMIHANEVVAVTGACRNLGVSFATSSSFVSAISAALRAPTVSHERLLSQVTKYHANINKRATREEYLEELEALYNYRNRGAMIPLKMLAVEAMRLRNAVTHGH